RLRQEAVEWYSSRSASGRRGRHSKSIDSAFYQPQIDTDILRRGLGVALALIFDEAYERGLNDNSQKLSNHLINRLDTSNGPYYIENLSDLAKEGFESLLKLRGGEGSDGAERVNWSTWLSKQILDLTLMITNLSNICIDEVGTEIPTAIRLACFGILEN